MSGILRFRLVRLIISVIGLLMIFSLSGSIMTFWQRGNIVVEEEKRLLKLQKKNEELKKQLAETQTPEFVEKQAREKLNMSKDGEIVVILPKITPFFSPTPTPEVEIWQQWLKTFHISK